MRSSASAARARGAVATGFTLDFTLGGAPGAVGLVAPTGSIGDSTLT